MSRTVLITGGAGFIGSNLARVALERDWHVRVLDNLATGLKENLIGLPVELTVGDILDPGALDRAMRGVEAVVHLAALGSVSRSIKDPVTTHRVNATGTVEVLQAARRNDVGYVTISSSSSVYGLNKKLPKNERDWTRPMSPYAVSKLCAEQYVLAYQQSYDFTLTSLAVRLFNVFGPRQRSDSVYAAAVPLFTRAILDERPLTLNGTGEQSRDFTYVGDVCETFIDAIEKRVESFEPVNLCFGSRISLTELVGYIEDVTQRKSEILYGPPRAGDVMHSQGDPTRFRELFPEITQTPFSRAIRQTVDWAKDKS